MPSRRSRCAFASDYDEDDYGEDFDDFDDDGESRDSEVPEDVVDDGGTIYGRPCGPKKGPLYDLGAVLGPVAFQFEDASFSGAADSLPADPGLVIEGFGPVSLPITRKAQVTPLSRVGKPVAQRADAPLYFPGTAIKTNNAAWQKAFNQLVRTVISPQLGLPRTNLVIGIQGLLLYRPGDLTSVLGADAPKNNAFAVVSIQLPSNSKGGSMQIFKKGSFTNPDVHDLGGGSGGTSSVSRYAVRNVQSAYTMTPATSGYRLVLQFVLGLPNISPMPSLRIDTRPKQDVVQALANAAKADATIMLLCDELYGNEDIAKNGSKALRGKDRTLFAELSAANDALASSGYAFYIGAAEKTDICFSPTQSFAKAEWGDKSEMDLCVSELYSLDGKVVDVGRTATSRNGNFDELSYFIDKDHMFNPDRKSWKKMWHGYRITSHGWDDGGEGVERFRTYLKHMLIAWPKQRDARQIFCLAGESRSFDTLVVQTPTVAQVTDYVHLLTTAGTCRPICPEQDLVRRRLLDMLVSRPDLHHLLGPFLDFEPTIPNPYNTTTYGFRETLSLPALSTLLKLIGTEALWNDESIRDKVGRALGVSIHHLSEILVQCFRDKVPAWQWNFLLDLLIKALANSDLSYENTSLWRIAIDIQNDTLCKTLVNAMIKAEKAPSGAFFRILAERLDYYPTLFAAKRHLLEPLLLAQKDAVIDQINKLPPGVADFSQPKAVFPEHREVEAFLRGPEKSTTLRADGKLGTAKTFIAKHQRTLAQYSCTLQPVGSFGVIRHISLTKAGIPAAEEQRQSQALQSALSEVNKLLAPMPVVPSPSARYEAVELRFHLATTRETSNLAHGTSNSGIVLPAVTASNQAIVASYPAGLSGSAQKRSITTAMWSAPLTGEATAGSSRLTHLSTGQEASGALPLVQNDIDGPPLKRLRID